MYCYIPAKKKKHLGNKRHILSCSYNGIYIYYMHNGRLAARMTTNNLFISVYIFHGAHQAVSCFSPSPESGLGL